MFKMLFNLMLLIVLAAGAFYVYTNVSGDYELLADIQNTKDQWLVQMQEFIDQVKEDLRQVKDEAEQMKRSAGF